MNIDKQKVIDKAFERHELGRKTIGVDVSSSEIYVALIQALVDEARPKVEDRLEQYEGKRFKDFGKLEMLENIEASIND